MEQNSKNGKISWLDFKDELGKDSRFYDFIDRWGSLVEERLKVERIFISTGNHFLMGFGLIVALTSIIVAIVVINYYPLDIFPAVSKTLMPGILLFTTGFLSFFVSLINEKGAGRFTPEGRLYYQRWSRFRDYLKDFSALKEHTPESIKLWDLYMVYAVALGVAERVIKNMSRIIPAEKIESSGFYAIHDHPRFFSEMQEAYNSSNPTSSGASFGGAGGVGGGFGGGGGGAR